jgi:hypothetical protein
MGDCNALADSGRLKVLAFREDTVHEALVDARTNAEHVRQNLQNLFLVERVRFVDVANGDAFLCQKLGEAHRGRLELRL